MAESKKLTQKKYWNARYSEEVIIKPNPLKKIFSRLFPDAPWDEKQADLHRWQICDKYLSRNDNWKVLEIGCAPGSFLVSYNKRYGYNPWGIDYSSEGVTRTQRTFKSSGLNPDQIEVADFFSDEVSSKYANSFDIVTSHGFIEHFDNVADVINRHIQLLKKGGLLVITIPNLRGFNYLRARMSSPEKLAMHNLSIMKKTSFSKIFENHESQMETLFSDYIGTLTVRHLFPRWMPDMEGIVDKMIWLILKEKALTSAFFSPHLMYIGRKIQ